MIMMMDRTAGKAAKEAFSGSVISCLLGYEIMGPFVVRISGKIKRTPEGVLLSTHCGVTEVTI
jgi:hypothetical protein